MDANDLRRIVHSSRFLVTRGRCDEVDQRAKKKAPVSQGLSHRGRSEEPSPALRAPSPASGRGEDHSSGTSSSATHSPAAGNGRNGT
jgi:hypothetical protein